jgi:hypothetical protein
MRRSDDWISELYYKEERKIEFNQKDFYETKDNLMVMTEEFHIQRGSCCGSGCRHCPYWPPHKKMNTNLRDELKHPQVT